VHIKEKNLILLLTFACAFSATGDLKSLTAAEAQLVEASLIEQSEKNDDHIEAMLLSVFEEVRLLSKGWCI